MANWYSYTGNGDPTLATSYRLSTVKPVCNLGVQICAIYLNQNELVPNAFNGVATYIANALVTLTSQPTGGGIKRFVYLKCSCG
ncbi:hypothetical protein [Pedobacter sp. FW305-3-2-15-E-R2A2]|uniref:hypothetical protein n=1 Tax=Pedobacter sp. FW305-3-2-15-E-R2A2 TaxID=3140251 RepID=UPI00313FF9F5